MKRTTKFTIDQVKQELFALREKGFENEEQIMLWLMLEYLIDAVDNLQERCHSLEIKLGK